jgi:small GTP-binding protein
MEKICIALTGDFGVGKTTMLKHYLHNQTQRDINGAYVFEGQFWNERFKLCVNDTIGYENFRYVTGTFYKDAQVVIIMYSVADRKSFESLEHWINDAREYSRLEQIPILVVANKCDTHLQDWAVTNKEASEYVKHKLGDASLRYNVTAMDSTGVQELLEVAVKMALGTSRDGRHRKRRSLCSGSLPIDAALQCVNERTRKHSKGDATTQCRCSLM